MWRSAHLDPRLDALQGASAHTSSDIVPCCLLLMWRSPKKHSLRQGTKACSEGRLRFGTDTDYADDPARAATGGLERRRDGGPAQNMEAA